MILGLDVSTSSTGWAIIKENGEYVTMGTFNLTKHDTLFSKAEAVRTGLEKIKKEYEITAIAIEEPLQSFRRGFSSAHTLLTLARFNGIVSWLSFDVFKIDPKFFDFKSARKSLGIKIDKEKDTKDQVMEWMEGQTSIVLERREVKAGKKKGQIVYAAGINDAVDAYVMARAICLSKSP